MSKGLIAYAILFIVLITAGIIFSSVDQITPTVAESQAEMSLGVTNAQTIEKGAAIFVKLLIGGVVAGIAAAVFAEVRKAYKAWKRNSTMRRWSPGPNAKWQSQQQPTPKLRREDLMLLALAGKISPEQLRSKPKVGAMRVSDDDESFEMEF